MFGHWAVAFLMALTLTNCLPAVTIVKNALLFLGMRQCRFFSRWRKQETTEPGCIFR